MRTTVTLDDDLYRRLERLARQRGVPFKQILNEVLRGNLGGNAPEPPAKPYRAQTFKCRLLPGIDPLHFNRLADDLETDDFIRENQQ